MLSSTNETGFVHKLKISRLINKLSNYLYAKQALIFYMNSDKQNG